MYKFFLFVIFYFTLPNKYISTECFDFQCFDGGHASNGNCFPCRNVSSTASKYWDNHLENMIYIGQKLQRNDLVIQLKMKKKEKMYCCNVNEMHKTKTCSLAFSSGSKDGIMHFGMGCTKDGFWLTSTCHKNRMESRCCKTNHCNSPNLSELAFMMKEASYVYPNLKEVDNRNFFLYICLFMIMVIFLIIFICAYKMVKHYISSRHSTATDLTHRQFYRNFLCFNKIFSIIRSYRRRSNINLSPERDDTNAYEDSTTSPFYRPYNLSKIDSLQHLSCSGSGFGLPVMTRRTAATDISLIQSVGEGRFGTVWLGKWNGDNIAVKIFSSRDEVSWAREKEMYQQNFLRHSNVLGFVTTDRRDNGLATELWLVTDYHERGSLFEYLRVHMLSVEQAVKMMRSITNGLAYLHVEINGLDGKPGIAHRDLKSRNILVKSCGECCIGDLGLAVRLNEDCSSMDLNNVGTRRYMAPEIIMDTIIQPDMMYNGGLEAFKKSDIYSYSLVIWEIMRRCECLSMNIVGTFYEMPYQNLVGPDPSIEEMRQVICEKKLRPPINPQWDILNPLKEISKSMQESWFEEPASRLNIIRLKKIMANAWTEVGTLKKQISDIATCSDFVSDDSVLSSTNYHCKSPFSNTTVSTEFPSSLTSNDIIPNIVIKSKDVFSTGSYCLGNDESSAMLTHS